MRVRSMRLAALCALVALLLTGVPVNPAFGATDDELPGCTWNLTSGADGEVSSTDPFDVYGVELQDDEELTIRWRGQTGSTVSIVLLSPAAASASAPAIASSTSVNGSTVVFHYKEAHGKGRYYIKFVLGSGTSATYTTYATSVTSNRNLGVSMYQGSKTVWMASTRTMDTWVLWVRKYRSVDITLVDPTGAANNFFLYLYADDGTLQRKAVPEVSVTTTADTKSITYSPMGGGPPEWGADDYAPLYVSVVRASGSGYYALLWNAEPQPAYFGRVSGATRFDCATELVNMTRYPFHEACSDVVVASGDDAAMADPLAAAGLCWAYNAPLVLVSKNAGLNGPAVNAISDMKGFNGTTKVHVIGGPASIPTAVYDQLKTAAGGSANIERINGANRYDVARNIAARMRLVRSDAASGVLIANGADPDKFFDALAMSAIAANTGMPVALVRKDSVPTETKSILSSVGGPRYVAGGQATISEYVRTSVSGTRWAGPDRYATARVVADNAIAANYLRADNVAISAKLADALSAGANVGFLGGPILLVQTDKVPTATSQFMAARKATVRRLWPVGGPKSIEDGVIAELAGAPY